MSCGRHRRRSIVSSTLNSRLNNQHEGSISKTKPAEKFHHISHRRKCNHAGYLTEQISRENTMRSDRFQILDDHGTDVTPRLITDYLRVNRKNLREDRKSRGEVENQLVLENQEQSASEKSILDRTNSTSNLVHTATVFSIGEKTTLDIGTRIILESEHLLDQTENDRISHESMNQAYQTTFLPGLGLECIDPLKDDVVLSESETKFILDLTSHIVCQEDHDKYNEINEKNKTYMNLCKNRQGNDLYIERGMQTFNDLRKHKQIITDPVLTRSQQSWFNMWDLYDSAVETNQNEDQNHRRHPIYRSQDLYDNKIKNNEYENNIVEEKTFSSQNSPRFFSQDSLGKMTLPQNNCFQLKYSTKTELPDIDVDAFIMERILNLNNRPSIINDMNNDSIDKKDLSSTKHFILSLERLWHYSCYLTHNRSVSCLCWNEKNHDLLTVGYGKFQYNNDKQGLVCCWNVKNPEFPERYYQTDAGVTSLSFSLKRPNLLAVGLFNGNICIFDLNQNNTSPIVDTNENDKKHSKPVWQIYWNEQDRLFEINNIETLVSISSDGRMTQWILRKEFEATDLMHFKSYNSSQTTCRALKKDNKTNNNGYFSKLVGGLCFDMHLNDKTIYLCGTDEGSIHRCSTIYNEKYLESYIGHTGPVYKVHWSPFAENIFLSASADWTVRLWMIGCDQSCMIVSSSNSKIFFDAIWSPKSSTMFCCVSENTIEIWDLSKSTLDPICIATSTNQRTLTSIAYATDSDCVLVGTSDGAVWIYHLANLSSSANANDLITIVQQSLLGQLDSREKTNIYRETSFTSIQSN
ncbi:unnamed protein product [Rotaria socialis]|uniref:Dynein axonemal intermediate chain 4 n=1 Tax=Rotaria socialis TaxID=392032 RepID=A0A819WWY6_9BILA|nr:unnamed protein product [Rotaria socialis]CAF3365163.1 unnamed protein product [Rotaria socialis]CAF3608385.1 unnamed protein product [Rotaria socialis]CAF4131771.1 unnamed protein product [Rotaria socialis]CAF4241983.1 unnamed protein product [Rotaria socialis]